VAFRAGGLSYRIVEKLYSIFFNLLYILRLHRIKFVGHASMKVFSNLWKKHKLQPLFDFSPIREFIDLSQNINPLGESASTSISVVIPCHPKDSELLHVVLEGLERNCLNPISEVIIVSPENINNMKSSTLKLRFLRDSEVVDSKILEVIRTNFPKSQFGWVLQQVIKIQASMNFSQDKFSLVLDSDTVLSKPTLFIKDECQILSITREYHRQYVKQYQKFAGTNFDIGLSFVTHFQLWQQDILEKLWGGARLVDWLTCADTSSLSSMSEYHSYGSFLIQNFPNRFKFAVWGNLELSRSLIGELSYQSISVKMPCARNFSIHSYS
jgi:hypothetical protein